MASSERHISTTTALETARRALASAEASAAALRRQVNALEAQEAREQMARSKPQLPVPQLPVCGASRCDVGPAEHRELAVTPLPADDESEALGSMLECLATELPTLVLVVVLRPLPGVEIARLACVKKAYLLALVQIRQQIPGPRYAAPTEEHIRRARLASRIVRAGRYGDVAVLKVMISSGIDEHGIPLLRAREQGQERTIDKALCLAAFNGHVYAAELLLDAGASVHAHSATDKDKALRSAAHAGHTNVVVLLIRRGADIHAHNDEAFRRAIENGNLELIELLLVHGADANAYNGSSLKWACAHDRTDILALLLSHGADSNRSIALTAATQRGHYDAVEILLRHGVNKLHLTSALHYACAGGRSEIAALLIEHGATVDAYNGGMLEIASQCGHVEIVALLIKHGADVHAGGDAALRAALKTASDFPLLAEARDTIALLRQHGAQLPEDDNF
jgi:ankyrin repeat protein